MKTILCTTGTSIANGIPALYAYQKTSHAWEEDPDDLSAAIVERLRGFDLSTQEGRIRSSAELHSLERLGLDTEDRVVLLATDTAEGRIAAEALRRCLGEAFGLAGEAVQIVRVEGLQVRDGRQLRETGLPNLIEAALHWIEDPQCRYGGEIVLNPTGGFKGVVPFMTILGMLFALRTVYVFEFAEQLIQLPPLPISFNLHLYERALPALERLRKVGAMPETEFLDGIENYEANERDLFAGFIERDGDLVTLSTLGTVLLRVDDSGSRTLKISPEVKQLWETAKPDYQRMMERDLIRVSHPVWRSLHGHGFHGSGLRVFGEGKGSRIAGFFKDDVFHICTFHSVVSGEHDAYEKAITGKSEADFDPRQFTEWQASSDLKSVNDAMLEAERDQISQLNDDNARLQKLLNQQGGPYREELRQARTRLKDTAHDNKGLRKSVSTLQRKLNAAENDLEALKAAQKESGQSDHGDLEKEPDS